METQLAQIVNIGLAGEPEHAVLQVIDTLKIFEFSKIVDNTITNGDITHPIITRILDGGHKINITFDENDNVNLHF